MKKIILIPLILIITVLSIAAVVNFKNYNNKNSESLSREVVLQFIAYNGYGNNLYIDNVLTGIQPDVDIMVSSFTNITYDTTYAFFTNGSDTISPQVAVSNIGRSAVDSFNVFLDLNSGAYLDSVKVPLLLPGQTKFINFQTLDNVIGKPLYLKSYTSYSLDSNRTNDTLRQYSIVLPGFRRNVLFEEFTSNASPGCANNNPELDAFVNSNLQTVTAIKYHLPLGASGIDSFYLQNPEQNAARSYYYFGQIIAVPTTVVDGKLIAQIPYGDSINLYNPYYKRLDKGSPLTLTVEDERLDGDSIKANVTLEIASRLTPGNYRLKINAVQRYINSTASNGETNFFDVFREVYPDTNGIIIPEAIGSYQFSYTYYREPDWADSTIYTSVFVQNNSTKEILNSAKSRIIIINPLSEPLVINKNFTSKPDIFESFAGIREVLYSQDSVQTSLNIELFEGFFPPIGWKVYNEDGYITFNQYNGVNGPTLGGTNSVIMDFFDYNIPGQRDTMFSKIYSGLVISDTIRFDYAYAQYNTSSFIDSLTVRISADGGLTFPLEIFRKGGIPLSTAPQTTAFFIPSNSTQWKSFKFSLGGVVSVNNDLSNFPDKYILDQNFPNPFNPSTKIRYQLPVSNFVVIKIFNIQGKEIATLVNEKQSAGKHEINFDANSVSGGLSSGVYFYNFNSEGYSETKRMMFLK
ncbi:MAG TPA: T9SS type A sorting domain-containing protein [Ignavibacteria bacterium]|nr:T9SS type A sorting domain-containing protein [Ignavibacteria bacterium]